MQITAESKRWVQKKSKLISRLSSNYSLKVVKKVKKAQRSGSVEISGKIRGKRYNAKPLGMLYNANNSRKQTMGDRKNEVKKKGIDLFELEIVKKRQKCPKVGTFGKFGENNITQNP